MKNRFLVLGLASLAIIPAVAGELSVDDVSSREYLMNHGYSRPIADAVERSKLQVSGVYYTAPVRPEHPNKAVRWMNKFCRFMDPAVDTETFMNHDTSMTPGFDDL
jgi:hypothetical protein